MAGISSKALAFGEPGNKYGFNSGSELNRKEFQDGTGLDIYITPFRGYDPQIGRFHQNDPLCEVAFGWSLYTFCLNNPIIQSDPLGLLGDTTIRGVKYSMETLPEVVLPATKVKPGPSNKIEPNEGFKNYPVWFPDLNPPVEIDTRSADPKSETRKKTNWGLVGKLGSKLVGTVSLLLTPMPDAGNNGWRNDPNSLRIIESLRGIDPYIGHGNKKENTNPHIVYTFAFIPNDGLTPVLKFGISDLLRNRFDRPESQLDALRAKWGPTVNYTFVRAINREQALMMEQFLVDQHFLKWGSMPREQIFPKPTVTKGF